MIADLTLERFLLGELPPAEASAVERALATEPEVRARLEALKRDSEATLAKYAPRVVNAEVQRRLQATARPVNTWAWLAVPAAIAAIVVAVWASTFRAPTDDDIRFKGDGPALRLFRQTASGPQRLADGSKVHPHELVQVEFDAVDQTAAVIVSVDGAGQATLHGSFDAKALAGGGKKALDHAFELDEAPGFERFLLVADTHPLSTAEVMQAAEVLAKRADARTASLKVPSTATTRSVLLEKGSP